MTPAELKRIIPFMEALTEGKVVEMKMTSGNWAAIETVSTIVVNSEREYRIVEPPKPLECWVNVYDRGVISIFENIEDARKASGTGTRRIAVHMVEAKEGE